VKKSRGGDNQKYGKKGINIHHQFRKIGPGKNEGQGTGENLSRIEGKRREIEGPRRSYLEGTQYLGEDTNPKLKDNYKHKGRGAFMREVQKRTREIEGLNTTIFSSPHPGKRGRGRNNLRAVNRDLQFQKGA